MVSSQQMPAESSSSSSTEDEKSRYEKALNEISLNFTSFLQTFMRDSNYDFQDTEVFSSAFLTFMHNALFYLVQHLLSLKLNLSQKIFEEEQSCIDEIYRHNPLPAIGDKINEASKLMKTGLPNKIKQCMTDAQFEQRETEENHDAYVFVVSNVLILETGTFLRFKERFKYSTGGNNNSNNIMMSSQISQPIVPYFNQSQPCINSNDRKRQKKRQ